MPRFFFHTADGRRDHDDEGVELAGRAAARAEAIRYGGALLQDEADDLWDGKELRVSVTDEDGRLLVTVVMLAVDSPEMEDARGGRDASPAAGG